MAVATRERGKRGERGGLEPELNGDKGGEGRVFEPPSAATQSIDLTPLGQRI